MAQTLRKQPLAPALLVAAASSFVGMGEQGGDSRGQVVEHFLSEVRQPPGKPWCAAFVYHVGYWSQYNHLIEKSSWPLPRTASCDELGKFARRRGILVEEPQPGDVFLVKDPELARFVHAGVVVSIDGAFADAGDVGFICTTVEGNTDPEGSGRAALTLVKSRTFSVFGGDRFIRWVDMEIRKAA